MRSCNDHVKSSELVLAGRSISWENNSNDVMDFSQCHLAIKGSLARVALIRCLNVCVKDTRTVMLFDTHIILLNKGKNSLQ